MPGGMKCVTKHKPTTILRRQAETICFCFVFDLIWYKNTFQFQSLIHYGCAEDFF